MASKGIMFIETAVRNSNLTQSLVNAVLDRTVPRIAHVCDMIFIFVFILMKLSLYASNI